MKKSVFVLFALVGCGIQHYQSPKPLSKGHHPGLGMSFFPADSGFKTVFAVWQASYRYGFNDKLDAGVNLDWVSRKVDTSATPFYALTITPGVRYCTPRWGIFRSSVYTGLGYSFGRLYQSGGVDTASYALHITAGASPGVDASFMSFYIPLRYTYGVPPDLPDINWVGMFSGGLGFEFLPAGHPLGLEALFHYAGKDPDNPDKIIATMSWGIHFAW